MKKYIIIIFAMMLVLPACNDVLDIKPTNMISEQDVKNDPVLLDAYLTNVYNAVRWQSGGRSNNMAVLGVCGGEMNVFAGWQGPYSTAMTIIDENGAPWLLDYWPYDNIRSTNEIIQILENPESNFDDDFAKQKIAEARFLRAFMYFELVKRYGGVPLITEPQSIDQPIEELYVKRTPEAEIYDFIGKEMDEISQVLPSSYGADEFGRASKWAALALKSRAMLYAASIARFSTITLPDGVVGIPQSKEQGYWQAAYDAAIDIINDSPHALYNHNPDPQQNYAEIFVKDGNEEVIFAEVYDLGLLKTHTWNFLYMPDGFRTGWGSNGPIYLEFVEKYEYEDGTSGKLNWDDLNGQVLFDIDSVMGNRDPRFRASVFYPETPWQGSHVYFHSNTVGTIDPESGWPKKAPARNYKKSGFLLRKKINEAVKLPISMEDETDWIVFRMGEVYLNAAEAAFYLNMNGESLDLLNEVRKRAGMPDKTEVTEDLIRNERTVELAFEEHHYWDLRRWRIAEQELNGKGFHGVTWVYNFPEHKYTMKLKSGEYGDIRTFQEKHYYLPLGTDRLADNPNLIENPGYSNTGEQ